MAGQPGSGSCRLSARVRAWLGTIIAICMKLFLNSLESILRKCFACHFLFYFHFAITNSLHISDVETNQSATTGINDAAAGMAAAGGQVGAEAAQDNLAQKPEEERVPAMSETLENLNSVAANITSMSDKSSTIATPSSLASVGQSGALIHAHFDVGGRDESQPKAGQLENNLPEKALAAPGEKQSCSLQAPSIMNDQQEEQPEKNKAGGATAATATTAATTSASAMSKQISGGGGAATRPMMDDRPAVDFIEGDSPTSATNCQLNAGTNHKAQNQQQQQHPQEQHPQEQHQQEQHQQELMKTSQHTSNQVTTAAAE